MAESSASASMVIPVVDKLWEARAVPGFSAKIIWSDPKTQRVGRLLRVAPGATLARHRHVGDEFVYVLEGVMADDFGEVTAGQLSYRPVGCIHTVTSPTGATCLIIQTGGSEPTEERGEDGPRAQMIDANRMAWGPMGTLKGIRYKPLWGWDKTPPERRLLLLQGDPGASMPRHRHLGEEMLYVMEGAIADDYGEVSAGNGGYRPNGCVHSVSTRTGFTEIAFVWGVTEPA